MPMKCPHCNKELIIDDVAYLNVDSYDGVSIINTKCCNSPVTVQRATGYTIKKYDGTRTEDNWGNPILSK